jgi:hypothetical protein
MKVAELFPSKYMNGEDLDGKAWTFKISRIQFEEMHDKQRNAQVKKPVVYFSGPKKGLILNRTLAGQIAQATGQEDTDQWPGCQITIYPTTVRAFGADHVVVRVRKAESGPSEVPDELAHDPEEWDELADELS